MRRLWWCQGMQRSPDGRQGFSHSCAALRYTLPIPFEAPQKAIIEAPQRYIPISFSPLSFPHATLTGSGGALVVSGHAEATCWQQRQVEGTPRGNSSSGGHGPWNVIE
ncbi:unnamed protein product, partial [Closterium sp. NIES-54]